MLVIIASRVASCYTVSLGRRWSVGIRTRPRSIRAMIESRSTTADDGQYMMRAWIALEFLTKAILDAELVAINDPVHPSSVQLALSLVLCQWWYKGNDNVLTRLRSFCLAENSTADYDAGPASRASVTRHVSVTDASLQQNLTHPALRHGRHPTSHGLRTRLAASVRIDPRQCPEHPATGAYP
jgi:hypothetical protein